MSNIIAHVSSIENGYIVTLVPDGRQYFIEDFDIRTLVSAPSRADHELTLRKLVGDAPAAGGKIQVIKDVRDYCIKNGYDAYKGLRQAKDFVESLRNDFFYPNTAYSRE